MDANIKNVPNKMTMIATGLFTQNGATGSISVFANAWCSSRVCSQANRPHNNKNAPIRKNPILYILLKQFIHQYWHNLINQVNHEVGKKHRRETTYNKPNIRTLIKIPFKYLMIIPPCNYLLKHAKI